MTSRGSGFSEFDLDRFEPQLEELVATGAITRKDFRLIEDSVATPFFNSTFLAVLANARERAISLEENGDPRLIGEMRCLQSLSAIYAVLTGSSFARLVLPESVLLVSQASDEDMRGGDLTVAMTRELACLLGNVSTVLRVQSKSSYTQVIKFLKELSRARNSTNRLLIDRNPNRQPLIVLNGQDSQEIIAAHAAYQILIQLLFHNQENEQEAIMQALAMIPDEVLRTMVLLQQNRRGGKKFDFTQEVELFIEISDGFAAKLKRSDSRKRELRSGIANRASLVSNSVAKAARERSRPLTL